MRGEDGKRRAVALRYRLHEDAAPRVIASGKGPVAERIIELASGQGIPRYRDAGLARVLGAMEVDQPIPPDLYAAVAEALAFVYRLNGRNEND